MNRNTVGADFVRRAHVRAGQLYTRYCEAVGGKAYDGSPLPTWDEFSKDEKKTKQADAWLALGIRAVEEEDEIIGHFKTNVRGLLEHPDVTIEPGLKGKYVSLLFDRYGGLGDAAPAAATPPRERKPRTPKTPAAPAQPPAINAVAGSDTGEPAPTGTN